MKKLLLFLALLALAPAPAAATYAANAYVVTTCGTLPTPPGPWKATGTTLNGGPYTVDVNGNICTSATISGSIATGGTATAAAPVYVEGQTEPFSLDLAGNLRTVLGSSSLVIGHVITDAGSVSAVTNTGTFAVQAAQSGIWTVTGTGGTFPVTGTFWQATQPVSIASGQVASGAYAAGSIADGADVTQGAKADAASTSTDATPVSVMSVLKEISAKEQAPVSRAVTNAGTFATQSAITAASGSIASGAVASGAYASGSISDGAEVTLGAKADAKSTATDTTAITVMQVLKEISAMEQAPASRAVTNAGTFATQSAITAASGSIASGAIASGAVASGAYASGSISDGAEVTLGAKADAKSTATDTTAITVMSVLKEISAMEQAPASRAVTNAGTFATQSAVTAASGAYASGSIASGAIASGAVASGAVASGAYVSGSIADGAVVTLGAKTDAKSTSTDGTSITIMQVLKEISAMEQAPASRAVTNAGTFATQSAVTAASGAYASGSIASGAVASGAIASGAIASGAVAANAYAVGSVPAGAIASSVTTLTTGVTRPSDGNAYGANDAFANSTSAPTAGGFTFTSACRASGGAGTITDMVVSASAGTLYNGEIWIFDQAVTATNDNTALSVSDSDILNLVGVIPFQTTDITAANSISYTTGLNIGYTCSGTANLRYLIKIMAAVTPASGEVLTARIKVVN